MYKTNTLARAVAMALVMPFANGAHTIEDLQNKLTSLMETANNIQALADAENRQLTEAEAADIAAAFAAFEATEGEIARRQHLASLNERLNMPQGRRTAPEGDVPQGTPPPAAQTPAAPSTPRGSAPARTPRIEAVRDGGAWGFRSFGEFAMSVRNASARGGNLDPRLIANAPTTYSQEGVGADGGFPIPPDFRTEILRKVMGEDSLLSRTDQQTSSSNSFSVPIDETTTWQTTGGIQAYWEHEASQYSQSKIALTESTTKLNKLTALVPVTDELLADASAMTNYLRTKAPEKMNFRVDDAIVNGTGAGQPLGFLKSSCLVTVNPESGQAADTIRHVNINNMWARMYAKCRRNAIWLVNQDIESQFNTMSFRDATSSPVPIYIPPGGLSTSPYGTLLGRPVVVSETAPEIGEVGDISLVDLSTYLSIVKTGGIRSDVSIHLWFDYDVTAFRFVLRIGGQPWWKSAITPKNSSNTRSCFVTLGERA
jgi:HK97 family phage major capsid protein